MNSIYTIGHNYTQLIKFLISVAGCFIGLTVWFRIIAVPNITSPTFQESCLPHAQRERKHNITCPVSTKISKYAQAHIDTALFTKFWSHPLKCHGTFVELGALDGNRFSNTKFFEDYLGWNGVLIEAYYVNFEKLKHNRPHTINYNSAICPEGQGYVEFIGKLGAGGIVSKLSPTKFKKFHLSQGERVNVSCAPIGSLLNKSNITKIDLFSLDVEGAELMVLQTMDWLIPVHVFIIEMEGTRQSNKSIRDLMKKKGFVEIKREWNINSFSGLVNNEVFINPKYTDIEL